MGTLTFGDYSNVDTFLEESRPQIYSKVIEIFQKMNNEKDLNIVSFKIEAQINGEGWIKQMGFSKENKEDLIETILPYFEEVEDYELCNEIKILYKELTND